MIKRANQKKKKGFSLIELIIVLAVMAIIALIAIPNFSAVRENSKNKADVQSCETIKRATLMVVSDGTVVANKDVTINVDFTDDKKLSTVAATVPADLIGVDELKKAILETKMPQGKVYDETNKKYTEDNANRFVITISTDGVVEVKTAKKA